MIRRHLSLLFFCFVVLDVSAVPIHAQVSKRLSLHRIVRNGLYGFIDGATGLTAIEPQFYWASDFDADGLAIVYSCGKEGYIDTTGKIVIPARFGGTSGFQEGLAGVGINSKIGFIDKTGNLVIPAQFDDAFGFSEGLAAVMIGERWGYIDRTGRIVIPMEFTFAGWFDSGIAPVKISGAPESGGFAYIDRAGRVVIQNADNVMGVGEGLADVLVDGLVGYMDTTGKMAIPAQFESGGRFSEGLAAVQLGNDWGYIDKTGRLAINPRFDYAQEFFEGRALVELHSLWGYIDKSGAQIIEPQFVWAARFHQGRALVGISEREWGAIDTNGKLLWRAAREEEPDHRPILGWSEEDAKWSCGPQ